MQQKSGRWRHRQGGEEDGEWSYRRKGNYVEVRGHVKKRDQKLEEQEFRRRRGRGSEKTGTAKRGGRGWRKEIQEEEEEQELRGHENDK